MNGNCCIKNIKCLYGITSEPHSFKKGEAQSFVQSQKDAYLIITDGFIADYGEMKDFPMLPSHEIIDAAGRYVMPTWVDSHTHIVFAESREHEYVMRLKGKTYEEIAAAGGGILNSAEKLADKSEDELYQSAAKRLEEVIGFGTGAIEIKSGYGLSFDSEVKILRVIKRLKENYDLPIKSTFLGAHAIPKSYQANRQEYIDLVVNEMLPAVVKENLADYCDVFCDEGFFTVEETDHILKAAAKLGLKAKIHANELANSGGVQVGIANDAISVDHLEMIQDQEIKDLLESNTIPAVLPSVSYFLGIPYAPARKMIDAGLGVVIASDYNPGSSPSGNIPFLMSLACNRMKLLPEEAFNAATINAAHALELEQEVGSIAVGKRGNVIITKEISSFDMIPYAFGSNLVEKTLLNGKATTF